MSTPSQPLFIWIINICIQINSDITSKVDNSHLHSWIILWHNQHKIFLYLPNHQHTIGFLPGNLSNTFIPFLVAPQTFIYYGPVGAWIENCQSNPTQTLFVEGVFMTDPNDSSPSQKLNLPLMFFTWYPNILFIIESFKKQDFKLKIPKEYDCNTHFSFFKLNTTLISCSLLIDFQAKTDPITHCIRPSHDSNPPPPS
ncbi:hypothetical protein O181_011026 [Austropuccinia psidii MF-1]|uniref:Uncharacterized protein n=1 Tax=Austropuccinia psidii MF-1 TaxID=1389203 RepID=A0A9Q3GKZ0_9BASI|nr:hypothetical protein [Austropuccinia psidii MF-1]